MEQLSLCSFIPELMDLENVSDEEVISIINNNLGTNFLYNQSRQEYEYKIKKVKLSISFSRYSFGNHERIVCTDMDWKNSGIGIPNDSIMDALDSVRRFLIKAEGINNKKVS